MTFLHQRRLSEESTKVSGQFPVGNLLILHRTRATASNMNMQVM